MTSKATPAALSTGLQRLGTETAFEVLARARGLEAQGRRVIHLEIGEPDFMTPSNIVEAGARALRDGHTHYCPAPGLPELRAACADHLSRHRQLPIDPARVVVAPGAKPFLFFGVLATCDPGDEVIYPNPGFPIYESVIRWAGATPVPLPLTEQHGFAFTAEQLAERLTGRTKLVIMNSPANPTGGIVDATLNAEIAMVLGDHDCWVLSDEVYAEMLYDAEHDTIAGHQGLLDRTILVDGFSKTFAMTGWRLGYAALPEPLVEPVTRLLINSVSCTPPAVQLAGVEALTGPRDEINAMTGGVPAPARRHRHGSEHAARCLLPDAAGRVLRLSQHQWHRPQREGVGRPAAVRRRRGGAGRNGVRRVWRGAPAAVLRELDGEPRGGGGGDAVSAG
jgi:aspartate/methionine/tyrosine aminotransferase